MAAYHLIHALQKLETEWNERAKADRHFKALVHPINFNPGIIKGGDWASSVPAWCDVDCRIAVLPGWSIADCKKEILACVSGAARDHRFLSNNPPDVEWSGFLSEGYELTNSAEPEAAFGNAFTAVYGGDSNYVGSASETAIIDALKVFEGPIIELHVSNIHTRDELHRHSITSTAATAVICGLGPYGYIVAMLSAVQRLRALPDPLPASLRYQAG